MPTYFTDCTSNIAYMENRKKQAGAEQFKAHIWLEMKMAKRFECKTSVSQAFFLAFFFHIVGRAIIAGLYNQQDLLVYII